MACGNEPRTFRLAIRLRKKVKYSNHSTTQDATGLSVYRMWREKNQSDRMGVEENSRFEDGQDREHEQENWAGKKKKSEKEEKNGTRKKRIEEDCGK